jgi:crotonobetainyl-CoA:carnitine CoA-transferase CaiB-like acyl-CoA transferase
MPHPLSGSMAGVASPMRFSETPVTYETPPPLLGQHTRQLLGDILEIRRDELDRLAAQKVI